jgi:AraC-like DNA-binding protein
MRQTLDPLEVRGNAVTHPVGSTIDPFSPPGWDQLIHAISGVMSVETQLGIWVVPPNRALWVPDGHGIRIEMHGRVAIRSLYLQARLRALPAELKVLNVSPLLRELVIEAIRRGPLDRRDRRDGHLIDCILDQLDEIGQAPFQLPQPSDPRARALASRLAESPAASVAELAATVGASRRTLERLFLADTGMPIARWRRQLRLLQALRLLGAGDAVTDVAHRVGYSTPSAFSAMFRTELGQTPSRYHSGPAAAHPVQPPSTLDR